MGITEQETRVVMSPIQFIDRGPGGELPAPLVRVRCCGMIEVQVLGKVVSTDPPLGRYKVIQPQTLRGRGAVPALMLLKLLASQPHRFASKDWLSTQMHEEMERGALIRLDTMASQLRTLLGFGGLDHQETSAVRLLLVEYLRNGRGSGPGYRLASYPFLWLDSDALACNVEQAARMERFGQSQDAVAFWQRAYALASRGTYLPDDLYSGWAADKRAEIEGALRQSVHALARLYLAQQGGAGADEAMRLLRSYWLSHKTDEDVLRPLMELLGKDERYQEAEAYYQQLCEALNATEHGKQPDDRTRDIHEFLCTRQIQRKRVEAPTTIEVAQLATDDTRRPLTETLTSISPTVGQNRTLSLEGIIEAVRELEGAVHLDGSRRRLLMQTLPLFFGVSGVIPGIPARNLFPFLHERLSFYSAAISACWKLYFDGELEEVENVLPIYIDHLTPLSQHFSKSQKHAASLLSQAHQLAAEVVLQKEDFGTSLVHCKQAITYGQIADDPNLQVAALLRQVNTLFYRNRPTAQTIQKAMQYAKDVSPLLRGRIYSEYAANIASSPDREQEALRYIGLSHDTFPEKPEEDPGYLYTHTTKYILSFNDTLAYLKQGKAENARQAIAKAGTFVSDVISPRRMELLKYQVISSIALEDLDQSCLFFEQFTTSAATLRSDLWLSELNSVYGQLRAKWSHEHTINVMEAFLQER